jgi:hypothetical protein
MAYHLDTARLNQLLEGDEPVGGPALAEPPKRAPEVPRPAPARRKRT